MYDFVDRSSAGLAEGSRFVLQAMRQWSNASRNGICPPKVLAPVFLRIGAGEVLGDFHTVMVYLHRHDGAQLMFGDQNEPMVTETEAVLLALWRDLVAERRDRVQRLVPHLVCRSVATTTTAAARRVAERLSALGLAPAGLAPAADAPLARPEPPAAD